MQIVARRYDTFEAVSVRIEAGKIHDIGPAADGAGAADAVWISPGFVDLQVNGYRGAEFADGRLSVDDVVRISKALDGHGVTRYCPTATTHSHAVLSHAVKTIARACDESQEAADRIAGIHLEGPYISAEEGPRGAHLVQHVRPPDWDEFQRLQDDASGRIRILTMSPEYDCAADFIARVAETGVLVAIGHTRANSDQIRAAVDAGARLSTHLGNGAHGHLRRHPNYIWDQLAEDRLTASLIADGDHLPPEVVKTFVRAKTPRRVVLVSDITGMAGMPPGRYESTGLRAVEVLEDGRLFVAGQRQFLAGASRPITEGIANVIRFSGTSLREAVDMAGANPANLIQGPVPRFEVGATADLVLFRLPGGDGSCPVGKFEVLATIRSGHVVYGSLDRRQS
jgi:N-acetylglucosamine-6-phosphate deacetylase